MEGKLQAQAAERRVLLEKLAQKTAAAKGGTASLVTGSNDTDANGVADAGGDGGDAKQSVTDTMKAKLRELEAEAESLGVNTEEAQDPASTSSHYPFPRGSIRGRGAYRGRGGYAPRGRGWDPSYSSS